MLTLVKNNEMIALDLQHRSMAILRVVGNRQELVEEHQDLEIKINGLKTRLLSYLTTKQLNDWDYVGHISQITTNRKLIASYEHIEELKTLLRQIDQEIYFIDAQEKVS